MASILYLFLGLICTFSFVYGAPAIGDTAPSFTGMSIDNVSINIESYRGKVVVLETVAPNTPYVTKYYSKLSSIGMGYIPSLQKQFISPPFNVIWISIAPVSKKSSQYITANFWKEKLNQWGATPTALIMDENGQIAHLYGMTTIPEVCIIGVNGKLVYRGAIDSIRGDTPSDIERVTNLQWFQTALENTLKNKTVYTSETIPYGIRIETEEDSSLF